MKKSDIRNKILNIRKKKFDPLKKINFNIIKDFIFNNSVKPVIGGYVPVNYEIDCLNILKKLENEKIKISLPVIKNNNEMEFYRYSFKFPMKINKYGIPEPFKTKILLPNILFVPLVAFDDKLYRIGYGKIDDPQKVFYASRNNRTRVWMFTHGSSIRLLCKEPD